MNLDFGFFNWQLVQSFILKGLLFSIELTIVAMIGGIALGTVLALMRLSGKSWLVTPAAAYVNTLRSIPLVMVILWFFLLIPSSFYDAIPGGLGSRYRSEIAALITFTVFEA
ncbi:MAG: ABC transporter permease subunit, partial [Caldimonas sp.]